MNVNITEWTDGSLTARCDDGHVLRYDMVNYPTGRWVHLTGLELLSCESWEGTQVECYQLPDK